jgi:hypothetical protein
MIIYIQTTTDELFVCHVYHTKNTKYSDNSAYTDKTYNKVRTVQQSAEQYGRSGVSDGSSGSGGSNNTLMPQQDSESIGFLTLHHRLHWAAC